MSIVVRACENTVLNTLISMYIVVIIYDHDVVLRIQQDSRRRSMLISFFWYVRVSFFLILPSFKLV